MKYKTGDTVIVIKPYASEANSTYKIGDVVTLDEFLFFDYWKTGREDGIGIFEDYFRPLTKLDKALK